VRGRPALPATVRGPRFLEERLPAPREVPAREWIPAPEDLAVRPAPTVVVTAADPAGDPLAGVRVRLVGDRRGRPAEAPEELLAGGTTDGHGAVALLPARRARSAVLVEAEGRVPERRPLAAGEAAVAVVLPRAAAVRGRVVEEGSGAPVAGARVEAFPGSGASAVADGEGRFLLDGLRTTDRSLRVRSARHPRGSVPLVPVAGETVETEIRLRTGATLRGRVTIPGTGRPVGEGTIAFRAEARSAPIAADGTFVLEGLEEPTQGPFRVILGERVFTARSGRPEIDPATGAQVGTVEVPLPANNPGTLAFHGWIADSAGAPVAGARVIVGWNVLSRLDSPGIPGGGPAETRTAADGSWRLPEDVQGNEVLVLHPDHGPRFVIAPWRARDRRFELPLPDPVAVRARVRDVAGRFAEGAEVRAFLRSPVEGRAHVEFGDVLEGMRADPLTDAGGRAVVTGLGPGSWYLVARSADGTQGVRAVLDLPEKSGDRAVDLDMAPLPAPGGRILDGAGAPLAGVEVEAILSPFEDSRVAATSGADGRFRFPPILPTPVQEAVRSVEIAFPQQPSPPPARGGTPALLPLDGEKEFRLAPR
jgi:hypothetical protein